MKFRDIIKTIEDDGWRMVVQEGSHRQYKHPVKRGRVTVPGKLSDEAHPKTLASIFQQAQLRRP